MSKSTIPGKPTIRENAWNNWYGYEGGRRTELFMNDPMGLDQEEAAKVWLAEKEAARNAAIEARREANKPVKQYIVRSRVMEAASRNPYRPKGQIRYGKWITVGTFPGFLDAWEKLRRAQGFRDVAIFYGDKRITDKEKRINEDGRIIPEVKEALKLK